MKGDLRALVDGFQRRTVLVIGDMVADEYILGRPWKISREAPVLVLQHAESFVRPGGACNTAFNICRLGARAIPFGVVGDDAAGHQLLQVVRSAGMSVDGLLVDTSRPTSTKTRVMARGVQEVQQQVVRIDRIDSRHLTVRHQNELIDSLCRAIPQADALLISDYEHGTVSREIIDAVLPCARQSGLVITVDSHGDLLRFKGVTAATPNQPEAEMAVGKSIENDQDLYSVGQYLLQNMDAQAVLITRGRQGIALIEKRGDAYHLPVATGSGAEAVDATGAGDTVAAVFTLALAGGASMRRAAYIANVAGGEVVQRLGAVAVTPQELLAGVERTTLQAPA